MSPIPSPPPVLFNVTRRRLPSPQAAAIDASPATAAMQAFAALHTICGAANTAVGAANFGPFGDDGSCNYDCGFMTQNWNWNADYTSWAKNLNLLPGVATMDAGAGYSVAFAPATAWLTKTLPATTTALNGFLGVTIPQIDQAIIDNGGVPTPQQTAELAAAFNGALAQVNLCVAEANQALQNVAAFVIGQSHRTGSLQNLIASMRTSVDSAINSGAENLENQLHCGQGDVQDQFNAMQTTVDASLVSLGPPLTAVNSQFTAALSAASAVAGVFLNIQSDSQVVTDQINLAQAEPPTSPVRTLHLNAATNEWSALASSAQTKLATS
jgi:hypothetical protein